jgi:hypothetical protein
LDIKHLVAVGFAIGQDLDRQIGDGRSGGGGSDYRCLTCSVVVGGHSVVDSVVIGGHSVVIGGHWWSLVVIGVWIAICFLFFADTVS